MAVWRAVGMGIVLMMLAVALGPNGWISQDEDVSTPAKCLFSSSASTIGVPSPIISFLQSAIDGPDPSEAYLKYPALTSTTV